MTQGTVIDHPCFEDYARAFQSRAARELGEEGRARLKRINCVVFPSSYLAEHWPGWEVAIPRPPELVPEEALALWQKHSFVFLRAFFDRAQIHDLYCDYLAADPIYKELAGRRTGKTSGPRFKFEDTYWSFRAKFDRWVDQNIQLYGCTLVCPLDEILARFDSVLREAFFPTPGPHDIGPKRRRKLQRELLRSLAPALEESLMREIWG